MAKAKRKPRPSMPRWWWLDSDGCWWCHNRQNCNSCKTLKRAELPKKRDLQEQQRLKEEIDRRVDDAG